MAQTKTQGKQEITQIETDQCNARKSVRSNRPVYAPLDLRNMTLTTGIVIDYLTTTGDNVRWSLYYCFIGWQ